MSGWIGVDLDGTLAEYSDQQHIWEIGPPVPAMVERVKGWLADGKVVQIVTARVGPHRFGCDSIDQWVLIRAWCLEHIGRMIPVVNFKDFAMIELWDDRCVTVERNTGRVLTEGRD